MSSTYLQSSDYAAYGLPTSLDASFVTRASALIDAYCHRPMGLLSATCKEALQLPYGRNRVILSYTPIVSIESADGRYGYTRRAETMEQAIPAATLYELSAAFGGPPEWESIDVSQIVIDQYANTGEIWIPAGVYMAHYTDIRIEYTAGYADYASLPYRIKAACADIVRGLQNRSPGAVSQRVGDMAVRYGDSRFITPEIATMLEPYRVKVMR